MKSRVRGKASVCIAVFVGFLVGSLLVEPARAHVTGSVGHVWRHIRALADARYGGRLVSRLPFSRYAVDTAGNVGEYTSITVGSDGLPVMSYYDATDLNGDLKVAKCADAACATGTQITPVDTQGDVGEFSSITVGSDGLPVMSYYDRTNGDLKVAKCANAACTTGTEVTAVDTQGDVGSHTSIAVGSDGLPLVSYRDETNRILKVAKCANPACTTVTETQWVDSHGDVGEFSSITVGSDGLPVISYRDYTNRDLKVAKCANTACTIGTQITALDSEGDVGFFTSITVGSDGLPVISYLDWTNGDLKVAKCANGACTTGTQITPVDTDGDVGGSTSITVGSDGLPVMSYYDGTVDWNGDLKVAKCANAACTSGTQITAVDTDGDVGSFTSITVGSDGLPLVSYRDETNRDLKVAHCSSPFCVPFQRRR